MDFAASVFCQATHHEGHVQAVPRAGKGGIRRGEFSATQPTSPSHSAFVPSPVCFARCAPAR